ncbi:hypothetical protein LSAT2_019385 [Lamellibrachia satsuma]|nr:hypothetical protein LSAT2_019385 [Lamellibrachia satsuma]
MCFPVHPRCRSATRKGKYDQATIASISRSRSASPRWCPRLGDECDDLAERPPFVVRKAEFQKLVGRTPGSKKIKSKYAKKTKRGRSVSPRPLSRCTVECIHCDGLFPESQCTLCRVYRRYTGQPYSYHFAPGCCCFNSKVIREPGNDPKPIYESDCDSEDSEVVSYKSYRSPSPYRSYVGRSSPACLRDNDLDSLDELAIDLQRARNRSTALERKCRKKRSKSRSLTSSSNRLTETDFRARLQLQ